MQIQFLPMTNNQVQQTESTLLFKSALGVLDGAL